MGTEYLKLTYRSRNAGGMHNKKLDRRGQRNKLQLTTRRILVSETEHLKDQSAKS